MNPIAVLLVIVGLASPLSAAVSGGKGLPAPAAVVPAPSPTPQPVAPPPVPLVGAGDAGGAPFPHDPHPVHDDGNKPDPLSEMPVLPKPQPVLVDAVPGLTRIAPGVWAGHDLVCLDGSCLMNQGPSDGLEVFACLNGGKTHEAVIRLESDAGQMVKFACIYALHVQGGVPSEEDSGLPARGTPMRVLVLWPSPDVRGRWLETDASCLVRDRKTDRPFPPLPYVYTGSRLLDIRGVDPDGKPVVRRCFMLDSTKSVVVNHDESDALFASAFPCSANDRRFEVNSAVAPDPKTPMRLVIEPVILPLTLRLTASGLFPDSGGGPALDDAALTALLTADYGSGATPVVRAVGVRVAATADPGLDVAARARLLHLAVVAKAWVVPVFISQMPDPAPLPSTR